MWILSLICFLFWDQVSRTKGKPLTPGGGTSWNDRAAPTTWISTQCWTQMQMFRSTSINKCWLSSWGEVGNICRSMYRVLVLCKIQKAPCCSHRKGLIWWNIKLSLSQERNGKSRHVEAMRMSQLQLLRCNATSYSAFLTFLLRAPSLSSSLVLGGEDGAVAGAWWWSSSETPRGEPNSRWQTQDSMRVKGEPWECRAVMTTWEDGRMKEIKLILSTNVLLLHFLVLRHQQLLLCARC